MSRTVTKEIKLTVRSVPPLLRLSVVCHHTEVDRATAGHVVHTEVALTKKVTHMAPTESKGTPQRPRLIDELRAGRREFFKTYGPGLLITLIGFAIALYFVEPPPPKELVIAAGPRDGNYYAAAQRYAQLFAKNGIHSTYSKQQDRSRTTSCYSTTMQSS